MLKDAQRSAPGPGLIGHIPSPHSLTSLPLPCHSLRQHQPPPNLAMPEFALFPQLPYDIRFRIWQLTLPYRDVKIGTCGTSDGSFHNTSVLAAPVALCVCSESREIALSHSRLVEVHRDPYRWDDVANVWFDRAVRTAYLPTDVISMHALKAIRCKARSIACLVPFPADAKAMHRYLASHRDEPELSGIETIYFGLAGIVYGDGGDTPSEGRMYPPYRDSEICVLGLDDERIHPLLEAALDQEREDNPAGLVYHQTTLCFLERLRSYWDTHVSAEQFRADHEAAPREADPSDPSPRPLPRLVPAVIFGKTVKALHDGRGAGHLLRQRSRGLVFKASDAPQWKYPGEGARARWRLWAILSRRAYDCQRLCSTPSGPVFEEDSDSHPAPEP